MDGTDIETLIRKKRTQKNILAEAFSTEKKVGRRIAVKKPDMKRQPVKGGKDK